MEHQFHICQGNQIKFLNSFFNDRLPRVLSCVWLEARKSAMPFVLLKWFDVKPDFPCETKIQRRTLSLDWATIAKHEIHIVTEKQQQMNEWCELHGHTVLTWQNAIGPRSKSPKIPPWTHLWKIHTYKSYYIVLFYYCCLRLWECSFFNNRRNWLFLSFLHHILLSHKSPVFWCSRSRWSLTCVCIFDFCF